MSRKLDSSAGAAGGEPVGGAERDGAHRAELAVDLVAHDDLDAQALALVVDALASGEAGAGGLDADGGGGAAEDLAGDLGGGGALSSAMNGMGHCCDQPAPAEHVVGGAELLGEGQAEVGHLVQRAGRLERSSRGCRRCTARRPGRGLAQRAARRRCPGGRAGGRPSP